MKRNLIFPSQKFMVRVRKIFTQKYKLKDIIKNIVINKNTIPLNATISTI